MTSKVIEGHNQQFPMSIFSVTLLTNTFIYESILIKVCMNANYFDRQIFHLDKYDLKGH